MTHVPPSTYGEFRVCGQRRYRGHEPGTVFDAVIDRATARAVTRRDIVLVRQVIPTIQPGSFVFPDGWLDPSSGGEHGEERGNT